MRYLSSYMEESQTNLFNKVGAFFAFGNKQFKEKQVEGVQYYHLGSGLICPQGNEKELLAGLDDIYNTAIQQDVHENGAVAIIEREYFNYESQISSTREAKEALLPYQERYPDLFTELLINNTFKSSFNKAVENDWF